VRGNERLLHRAWVNLLDNAIKYSPRDGIVTLTAQKENRHLRITIEDQGPGIPPEHRDRIFERFYRVDPGRDREKGGTGLGLSIVKHIIRIHRGSIAVSERPEGGSRFTIELPSADT
jgi:two-component system phosphate regulon sensor histidine kinase PhoR